MPDVTRPEPLPRPPSTPLDELSREQRLEILREQLRRATEIVDYSDEMARRSRILADRLIEGPSAMSPRARRARELIADVERELGMADDASGAAEDVEEQARMRSILLGRRMLAQARQARRSARQYRFRVAVRLAEVEAEEEEA